MQKRLKSILRKSIGKEPEPSKHDHGSNRDRNSKLSRVEDQPTSVDENSRSKPTGLGNTSPRSDRARPISSTHGSPATEPPSNVTNTNGTTQSNQNSNAQSSVPNRREIIHGQNSAVDGERVRSRKGVADDASAHPKTAVGVEHKASLNPRKTPNQTLPAQSVDSNHRGMDKLSRSPNTDEGSFASAMSSVSSDYGDSSTHNRGLSQFERSREAARSEPGLEKIQPDQTTSKIADHASGSSLGHYQVQGGPTQFQSATSGRDQKTEDRELREHLRLNGVDITDTVDTDRDITLAPAVKHELIKPHQHEIVESKIFREIHNYEHFHYIQPVMTTEVLPPRHWIPNPAGEGLIEISADELPARTGENRWWSVIQHESPYSVQKTRIKWRTEPEVIEHGMTMTEGGFERRETTIIHPPTLASLEGYSGPVQPIHFDHKTGKRWMGEMSTMEELQDLQRLLDSAPEAHAFQLNELNKSLPTVSSSAIPKRKSVPGEIRA